jgi:hypothetical protein
MEFYRNVHIMGYICMYTELRMMNYNKLHIAFEAEKPRVSSGVPQI